MPLRTCTTPGCPNLTNQSRCLNHRRQADQARGNAHQRGYTSTAWRKTRTAYLKANPWCECGCGQPATDVDHIDGQGPLAPRGHDWTNLRALTHSCHARRTAQDQPGGWNAHR